MKPKDLILLAKMHEPGGQQDALIRQAFVQGYHGAMLSFKCHFPEMYNRLSPADLYCFVFPDKSIKRQCACGADLVFSGPSRGFTKFCSTKCYHASETSKEQRRNTNIVKYGGPAPASSPIVLAKTQQTNRAKYGSSCSAQGVAQAAARLPKLRAKANETHQKAKNTLFTRAGVEFPGQLNKTIELTKTRIREYRESKIPEIVSELRDAGFSIQLENPSLDEPLVFKHTCGKIFEQRLSVRVQCPKCHSQARSKPERLILDFVRSMEPEVVSGDRTKIKPYEVDILVPHKNIGIEINGAYWHRDNSQALPLQKKSKMAENNGFRLLHFWDYEVDEKLPIVKSIIANALGHSVKIGARTLSIDRTVSSKECADFLSSNHIQGNVFGKVRIGLRSDGGELMAVLVISKSRYKKTVDYEIFRSCVKLGYSIQGAFSKMLKAAPAGSYISYADKRFFDGHSYTTVGFKLDHVSPPNYQWVNGKTRLARYNTQKHRLSTILEDFDAAKTEAENMVSHGFHKISDCGNAVFVGDLPLNT